MSLPAFWLGLLILMASVAMFGTMPLFNPNPQTWTEAIAIYCVPAMAVGFRSAALTMRITRSSMLEILRQDYIRTARAKGASETSVNYRHALKNAILPVITVIGIEAAFLIGGLIVTETVFNIPGVARFLVEAIRWRDYPIVQNLVMMIAVVVVLANFTVDMLYALVDPRIRYTGLGADLAAINYDNELRRAGAHSTHGWRRLAFLAQRHMLGTVGLCFMLLFVWAAAFADLICRYDPLTVDSAHALAHPDWRHWMGTDSFGRDVWSRIIHGARISLAVGIGSTALGSLFGVSIGLASGYLSGWVDLVFQRVTDILQALPLLVLALIMTAALGPTLPNVIIAIAIPADPDGRPRHPRQYAGAARAALCRGRQVDRHERDADRASPCAAQHAGAADRAGHRAARLDHSHRGVAVVSRARHSRTLSVLGPDAVGIGGGICPHRAVAGDLSRHRHQPCGIRNQSVR